MDGFELNELDFRLKIIKTNEGFKFQLKSEHFGEINTQTVNTLDKALRDSFQLIRDDARVCNLAVVDGEDI